MTDHWLDELSHHLDELRQNLEGLKEASVAQREAVVRFDLVAMKESHRKKFDCLSRIELIERLKNRLIETVGAGLPTSERNITGVVKNLAPQDRALEILDLLEKVRQTARGATQENESERSYVFHSLQGVEVSLKFMNRLLNRDQCHYTASGEINSGSSSGLSLKQSL